MEEHGLPWVVIALGLLFLLPHHGLRGMRKLRDQDCLPGGAVRDEVLFQLAERYQCVFGRTWTTENITSLILEDIGLSQEKGVLFMEPGALLSQNWAFAAGDRFFAGGVHIMTSCSQEAQGKEFAVSDRVMGTASLMPAATGRKLHQRLNDDTWTDFQVLRQVDLRLFKVKNDGTVCRVDPVSFMPQELSDADWNALKFCTTKDGTSLGECFQQGGFQGQEGESPVVCTVQLTPTSRFAVVEKQTYSWEAMRQFIVAQGHKIRSDELVACGPGEEEVAFLQTDPMRAIITKSPKVDFGLKPAARAQSNEFPGLHWALVQRQLLLDPGLARLLNPSAAIL